MTILGDLNQSINPFMNVGDYNNISHLFQKDNTCMINLTKSYRSTMEITLYTACTRALHVLCIYYSGKRTSLLGRNLSI